MEPFIISSNKNTRFPFMNRQQTILGLIGYVFVGTAAVLIPSVMPFIESDYSAAGLTLTTIAIIFPARAIGGILGNLLSGIGSDLLGRQQLVWMSAVLLAGSLALAGFARPWVVFIIGFVLVSATQGALSTGINAMIAEANRGTEGRALNVLHGIYGVGAAISPLIFGYLIEEGLPWRWMLVGTGLIWLVYGVIVYLLRQTSDISDEDSSVEKLNWSMLRQGPFLGLFVIAFIYNGVAWSLLGWIALFMQQSAGFSTILSLSMVSIFYAALTAGRFICAAVADRIDYTKILFLLAIGIALTYPLVVFGDSSWLVILGVFLTGLSLSGLYPTALAFGSQRYPEQIGTLTGTLSVAMTIGSMLPPFWTGIIAEAWNFQAALGVNYGMVLSLVGVVIYLRKMGNRSEAGYDS